MTLKEIAQLAQVSHQAVSSVLRGKTNSRVSPETRERILRIAREGGYKCSFGYQLLHGKPTRTVAIITAHSHRPVEPHVQRLVLALLLKLEQKGYSSYLLSTGSNREENVAKTREMLNRGVEHFIFIYGPPNAAELVDILEKAGKTWIATTSFMRRFIQTDTANAFHALSKKLYTESDGHFMTLMPPSTDRMRMEALRRLFPSLDDCGIQERYIFNCKAAHNFDYASSAYSGMKELLRKHPDVRAVQCANDAIMLGAANAALSMGRIPGKDLELGGANADDAVFLFPYPLHTFNIISREMVDLLIERMTDSEDCRILLKSDSFRTQTAAGRIFANPADPLREYLALSHINEDGNLPSAVLEGRNDQISSLPQSKTGGQQS